MVNMFQALALLLTKHVRRGDILDDIQSGRFTRDWMLENKARQASFKATRRRNAAHPIEEVGEKLAV